MGYTPVFGTIFSGTLGGQYPDTAAWLFFLALADHRGHVDCTPQHIARITGMPLADLLGCIDRFCAPDPASRSREEQGRRLALIDPERPWGWRIVNIQKYRDMASGHDQVIDGRNAEKVKRYKERIRGAAHPETPPDTGGHRETPRDTSETPTTPTHTQTHTQTETKRDSEARNGSLDDAIRQDAVASRSTPRGRSVPVDSPEEIATPEVIAWARQHAPDVALKDALAEFVDYWRGVPGARGRKLDWPATFRNRLRELQGKRQHTRQARGPILLQVPELDG